MENNISTAEEFFTKYADNTSLAEGYYDYLVEKDSFKEANQKSRIKIGPNNYIAEDYLREEILVRDITNSNLDMWISVSKDSILNAYPLTNIK